ncbi:hypothetical protein ACFV19_31220 [Streptomyces griseoluteus]|uniref:hypothetical protein n=1 Tax=Streptomyces griseoluteus TaxID=29306 RepID=UPI0036989069
MVVGYGPPDWVYGPSQRRLLTVRWMHAVNDRLTAEVNGWPASPDVLELALFGGAWEPVGQWPGGWWNEQHRGTGCKRCAEER